MLFSWERIGRPVTFETHIWKDRSTYAQEGDSKARTLTPGSQANVLVTRAPGCWLPRDRVVPSLKWVAGRRCVCPRPGSPFP